MRKIKVRVLALVAVMALLLALPLAVSAQQVPPHVIIGKATLNGAPAHEGTMVTAMVDGQKAGSTMVMGAEGKFETLLVMGPGDEITFMIGDAMAMEKVPWMQGGAAMQNLNAEPGGMMPEPVDMVMPEKGDKGARGSMGPAGAAGADGAPGATGPQGPPGPSGSSGSAGAVGAAGADGAEGPQGPAGTQGQMGPQGGGGILGILGFILAIVALIGVVGVYFASRSNA